MVRIFGAILLGAGGGSAAAPVGDVMMQAFYWDVPMDENNLNGSWWDNLSGKAQELKECGISAIWTPVPSKRKERESKRECREKIIRVKLIWGCSVVEPLGETKRNKCKDSKLRGFD